MDRFEAIEILLAMAKDFLAIEAAAGYNEDDGGIVETAIDVVEAMLEEERR